MPPAFGRSPGRWLLIAGLLALSVEPESAGETGGAGIQAEEPRRRRLPPELPPLFAARDVIRVHESTFDELTRAIEPFEFKSPENGPPYSIKWLCGGHWKANVRGIEFDITPEQFAIRGRIDATWSCGLDFDFSGSFDTSADVVYRPDERTIGVNVESVTIELKWDAPILGSLVKVRRHIDVREALQIPPIPVDVTAFDFETARGAETLRLRPRDIVLVKRDGHVEVQGVVSLY